MSHTPAPQAVPASGDLSTAEILQWQGKFRRVFVLLIGFGTISLKWMGVINSDSVVARSIGAHHALLLGGGLVLAYIAFVQLMMTVLLRRGVAGQNAVIVAVIADMALLFSAIYVVTPPLQYSRALIIAIFPVQFTQLYFGQRATIYNLVCVSVFYTVIVLAASDHGMLPGLAERFWDLSLFMIGTLLFVLVQGHIAKRLHRIMQVFERAQEGDLA